MGPILLEPTLEMDCMGPCEGKQRAFADVPVEAISLGVKAKPQPVRVEDNDVVMLGPPFPNPYAAGGGGVKRQLGAITPTSEATTHELETASKMGAYISTGHPSSARKYRDPSNREPHTPKKGPRGFWETPT